MLALPALLLLRQYKPEWALLLRIAATVTGTVGILSLTVSILGETASLCGDALPESARRLLLSSLGISLLTELCAGIARDCGEGSLAACVETAGRLEILLLSLPLIRQVLETALGLLSA